MKAFIKKINLEGDKVIWAIVLALSIFSILVVYSTAGWKFLFSHLIKLSIGLFFLYQVHKILHKSQYFLLPLYFPSQVHVWLIFNGVVLIIALSSI